MPETVRPFTALARVYDAIMADVEYEGWAAFALSTLAGLGWPGALAADRAAVSVLDLACGTGNSALPYRRLGYRVSGVDASEAMLEVARRKLPGARLERGGFLDWSLPERFHLIICVFDSLNNLTDPAELEAAFLRAHAGLAPGGWFVFDANTREGVRTLWDDDRFEGHLDGEDGPVSFLWTHRHDPATGLGLVTARWRTSEGEFVEEHAERGYDPEELAPMLRSAGFSTVLFLEYPEATPPGPDAPRVWGFARRSPARATPRNDEPGLDEEPSPS